MKLHVHERLKKDVKVYLSKMLQTEANEERIIRVAHHEMTIHVLTSFTLLKVILGTA